MGIFSNFSASKKQAQKLQEEKKQKEKASGEPKPKYMHTPKHAYVDALNSTSGATPASNRQNLKEAAERRKSRISRNSSYSTMNGLHSGHSSSSAITTMSSWEARKAMAQREQLQKAGTPFTSAPARKEYQSSPLASVAPSIAGPSTVSSYDRLDMAPSMAPSPLKPSLQKPRSSQKKCVTIQAPANSSLEHSPTSPTFDDYAANVGVAIPSSPIHTVQPSYVPVTMLQPPPMANLPPEKSSSVMVRAAELQGEMSSSSEDEQSLQQLQQQQREQERVVNAKKKISLFWRRRGAVPPAGVAVAAAG